jgi:fibronectin-binding autotransporter adhesin
MINLTGGSVTAGSGSSALYAFSADLSSNATINASGVAVSSGGYGVQANVNGIVNLTGGTVTTNGADGYGLFAIGTGATVNADGTVVQTWGDSANGAFLLAGQTMTLQNVTIVTNGANASGAAVDSGGVIGSGGGSGALTITGGSITANGSSSYGLLGTSGTSLTATDVAVAVTNSSSIGASAQFGAQVLVKGGTIRNTGDSGAGLFSVGLLGGTGASLTADGVTVTTSGANSHGAVVRGGSSLTIENGSSITTAGAGSAALYTSAYDANPGIVIVANSTLSSAQSVGIYTTGTTLNASLTGSSVSGGAALSATVNGGALNLMADSSTLTGAALTEFSSGSTTNVTLQSGSLWTMTGDSSVTNLTLDAGTLRYGAAATLSVANPILLAGGGGTIDTNGFSPTLAAPINGAGSLTKTGAGVLSLTGDSSGFSGAVAVTGGVLWVEGTLGNSASTLDVGSGGTLGGSGFIGGNMTVADGGILAPNAGAGSSASTLTINGDLTLSPGSILNYNFGDANVVGGVFNDLTIVRGDLTLDGTLNVTASPGGSFDQGIYRIISYGGSLTDNTLALGSVPAGDTYQVQTSTPGEVNLIVGASLNTFTFWNGGDAGLHGNGTVNGGDGVWQSSAGNTNWTDQTGVPIGPWSDGNFAIFVARPGTVTVDNSQGQVTASGMQFASDGYVIQGDDLTLLPDAQGQSLIRVGDGTSLGANFTATIASNLAGATQLVKDDLGTLVLSGANTYSGGTAINGGTLRVSADNNLGAASGSLSFDGGTLNATASFTTARPTTLAGLGGTFAANPDTTLTMTGAIDGAGSLSKAGAGTLLLDNTANTYSGDTLINAGMLQAGAANSFSPNSAMTVASAGTLELAGFSQTVAGLSNAGLINMGSGTAPGAVLTVNGDYVGNGGTIVFNTVLGADTSPTDRLVVNGSTSGATNLRVVNAGGLGAQTTGNGIELVEVNGASNGAFRLTGRLAAGAFDYDLFKNGVGADAADGDWYLRSSFRPEVAVDNVAPALASRLGLAMLGAYTQRTGDGGIAQLCADDASARRSPRGSACNTRLWGRVFGETGSFGGNGSDGAFAGSGPAYSFDYGGFQAGADLYRTMFDSAGFYAGAATLRSDVKTPNGAAAGRVGMDAYSLGAYWTHQDRAGWYTDLVLQGSWYDNIRASSSAGQSFDTAGWGLTASAEAGYRIGLGDGYSVIPQGQLIYQRTDLGGGADQFGRISYDATDEVYGRFGARFAKDWRTDSGQTVTGWADANVWRQFGSEARTTFATLEGASPTSVGASLGGSWAQLGLGLSGRITDKVSLFGAFDYNISLSQPGDSIGGRAGIRVSW